MEESIKQKAAVFILLGQSNAVGHAVPMKDEDKIKVGLKNVYGLNRNKNQSFDIKELIWENYTSGGMNLGETQDDTYSLANLVAKNYQDLIDNGNALPDLYIVQIAIGAQGATKKYMWNPSYEKKLIPGPLGICNISLYPLTIHIFSLLKESFSRMGKEMDIIGLHWRGSEEDEDVSVSDLEVEFPPLYDELFGGFRNAIGKDYKAYLHKIRSDTYCDVFDPSGSQKKSMEFINNFFDELSKKDNHFEVYDSRNISFYNPDSLDHGIYIDDLVHYTKEANDWVAKDIIEKYINGIK